jgi:hypothetical protein
LTLPKRNRDSLPFDWQKSLVLSHPGGFASG